MADRRLFRELGFRRRQPAPFLAPAMWAHRVKLLERQLDDTLRLLAGARMTLDACAEGRPYGPQEAAEQAQRIVDVTGHRVTDEPAHLVVALLEAERFAGDAPQLADRALRARARHLQEQLAPLLERWDT